MTTVLVASSSSSYYPVLIFPKFYAHAQVPPEMQIPQMHAVFGC